MRIQFGQRAHPEICHLRSAARTYHQYIVAREVTVDDTIRVQEGNGERDVVADVDLHVVGQRFLRLLQKMSEGVVH